MRDPYTVLGINRSGSEADVKSAFRKLAKRYHPDRNKDDPKAKERFAEISNAYEILGDKDKRGKFDRGEIDAEGKQKAPAFEGFGGGAGSGHSFRQAGPGQHDDILNEILRGFGGGQAPRQHRPPPQPGRDIQGDVGITLEELATGVSKRVSLPDGRTLEVTIPAWIGDGKTIRLAGQGEASFAGGKSGDVLLSVRYLPHARFTIDGADLRTRVAMPLADAVLGGTLRIQTPEGEVEMTLPGWTSGGKNFRLRGKGLPSSTGRGDIIAGLDIVLPEGDAELAALMQQKRKV